LYRNCSLILKFHLKFLLIREATNKISTKNRKSKSVYSYVTWLMSVNGRVWFICDMTHSYVTRLIYTRHESFISWIWMSHVLFICMTWLTHTWHDSHMNDSCNHRPRHRRHPRYEWVMSCMRESCHTYK